ncbi:hypothetical protein RM50_01855 [Pseudarthrobacter phenanthrenivorans]|uniref:O-antigen ligase domain-containing protein n=2 Tax=Pseudarthrobacter phenanthrenivorans TaxID=361575 RepID=A0A0B4DYC9_PSEPS|nr:hypothetical protein RM50_01855 [Pseudarthrobacter phenanthrenivorans]
MLFLLARGNLGSLFIILLIVLIYSSGYLQQAVPVRFMMAATVLLILFGLVANRSELTRRQRYAGLLVLAASFCAYTVGFLLLDSTVMDPLFRYTVLFPLTLVSGFLMARAGQTRRVAGFYVMISCLMGVLATTERLSGKFLVAGSYSNSERLFRDGSVRSIVFAEHPLVLSVLLLAAVPLVSLVAASRLGKCCGYASLLAGILSTNSRGAIIILACWTAFIIARRLNILGRGASHLARTVAIAAIGFLLVGGLFTSGSDQLTSSSALDASAEYRSALYSYAARSLVSMPVGWGIGGLPEGVYYVASVFGPLDLSKTVDSELALAAFDFGWIGVIAFSLLVVAMLNARRIYLPIGQSAFIVSISGLYLALHSWVGLGTSWMLIVGLALGAYCESTKSSRSVSAPTNMAEM